MAAELAASPARQHRPERELCRRLLAAVSPPGVSFIGGALRVSAPIFRSGPVAPPPSNFNGARDDASNALSGGYVVGIAEGTNMDPVAILQARTSSSRLPGKALLQIRGVPSAVLAALRASNAGMRVVVATSTDRSDDELAAALRARRVEVVRGPLSDVLGRFVLAAAGFPDDAVVVRLTADNVVNDGAWLAEFTSAFVAGGSDYLGVNWPQNGLPYGVGAEAFRAGTLRAAERAATAPYDREHVTPWIRRTMRREDFTPAQIGESDFSHLRCTIDDWEDYERVARLFEGWADPLKVPWLDLVLALERLPGEPRFRIPYRVRGGSVHGEMALGTVQLGVNYGVVNTSGRPSEDEAVEIVRTAIAHGVTELDTARGYGDSERVLGRALGGAWRSRVQVVTKLDPLTDTPSDATASEVSRAVRTSVAESCAKLGTPALETVLLHRWAHREAWGGAAWRTLLELRAEGALRALGASVYEPVEAREALADGDVVHVQLPYNLLDQRWEEHGVDRLARARPEVVIHARSALLQGLLAHGPERWPPIPGLDATKVRARLIELTSRFGRQSVAELCFAFVRGQDWITSVVVGCETVEQLTKNLDLFRRPRLSDAACDELRVMIPDVPARLLNPALWTSP